jgi:hypothetical protein
MGLHLLVFAALEAALHYRPYESNTQVDRTGGYIRYAFAQYRPSNNGATAGA